LIALLLTAGVLPAQEWSGTITVVESVVGPGASGADKAELDDYARLLKERIKKLRAEVLSVPAVVARTLREDIGFYEAELDKVLAAGGSAVDLGTTVYVIKGDRMLVQSDGARLVIDRTHNEALIRAAGKDEMIHLAPLSAGREIDLTAPETRLPGLGVSARRLAMSAEGKTCQVLVAPGLPNPYAIGLLPSPADEKDTIAQNLAILPGLPVSVEYQSGDVFHRWTVTQLQAGPIDDGVFAKP
jgi:hypothetical protein